MHSAFSTHTGQGVTFPPIQTKRHSAGAQNITWPLVTHARTFPSKTYLGILFLFTRYYALNELCIIRFTLNKLIQIGSSKFGFHLSTTLFSIPAIVQLVDGGSVQIEDEEVQKFLQAYHVSVWFLKTHTVLQFRFMGTCLNGKPQNQTFFLCSFFCLWKSGT